MTDRPDAREANRVYWETDVSVADIATRFDLSRRALYGAVEPLDASQPCDECGGPLEFENRLARRSGSATCGACGRHQHIDRETIDDDDMQASPAGPTLSIDRDDSPRVPINGDSHYEDARATDIRNRAVLLGSAAIAGMAIGGVAAWLARRRD